MQTGQLWDIFCTVIDNHGDLGVCWRLTRQLRDAGQRVRLWVDDASALAWMAPTAHQETGIEVLPWANASQASTLQALPPADVWVESFGCTLPEAFVAHGVATHAHQPTWINLEYLSAENWVPRMHRLPSPVMSGPAKGWTKTFFYPGFTPDTGGLLRETDLMARQQRFDRMAWRQQHAPNLPPNGLLISLFCYEPAALTQLLGQLVGTPHHLLVTPGRPLAAVLQALKGMSAHPSWSALPYTDQNGFDEMLWACDLNFVRGEDSLVRALWAGQPFIWHIYPQDDNAHHTKLEAFLDWMDAPRSLRESHQVWNDVNCGDGCSLNIKTLKYWSNSIKLKRDTLLKNKNLLTELINFKQ
jgi:uncharacterized repeat protein (TIGR03837 family)